IGPGGTTEAEASLLLAEALRDELTDRGAVPFLLRAGDANPPATERARVANQAGVEILIALHVGAAEDAGTGGTAAFYYGRADWHSQAGRRLAELIQHHLTTQLGMTDAGAHAKV